MAAADRQQNTCWNAPSHSNRVDRRIHRQTLRTLPQLAIFLVIHSAAPNYLSRNQSRWWCTLNNNKKLHARLKSGAEWWYFRHKSFVVWQPTGDRLGSAFRSIGFWFAADENWTSPCCRFHFWPVKQINTRPAESFSTETTGNLFPAVSQLWSAKQLKTENQK